MSITTEQTNELRTIILGELGLEDFEITDSMLVRELPGIESMKVLRIIAKIERQFDVELSDEVVFNIGTFAELVNAIRDARSEPAA